MNRRGRRHWLRSLVDLRILAVLLVTGCASQNAVRAGEAFTLRPGETISVEGTTVRFVEVTNDSRCPAMVTCVWEGDAEVALEVGGSRVSLHTAANAQRSARIGNLTIELLDLRPRPAASPTTNVPYEADLRLSL